MLLTIIILIEKWKIKILDVDPRKINKVELIKVEQEDKEEQSTENQEQ